MDLDGFIKLIKYLKQYLSWNSFHECVHYARQLLRIWFDNGHADEENSFSIELKRKKNLQ